MTHNINTDWSSVPCEMPQTVKSAWTIHTSHSLCTVVNCLVWPTFGTNIYANNKDIEVGKNHKWFEIINCIGACRGK